MNNLVLACLMLASAGILWLGQRQSLEGARATNRSLNAEFAAARAMLEEAAAAMTNTQELLALRRQDLAGARNEIAAAARAIQPAAVVPPDPAREGLWPTEKPYCYLAKQHLATIDFVPFSEDPGLTSEAAVLFGMSAAERMAVDRAYEDFLERTRHLHLTHAEPIEAKSGANTENHREIAYRIPALTNEFREVRTAFATTLEEALGSSRAEVFLKRARSQLNDAFGQYKDGYTIKYSADRQQDGTVQHVLGIERLDRSGSYGYRITFPIEPTSAMWKYRHLFGSEPLLQAVAQDQN